MAPRQRLSPQPSLEDVRKTEAVEPLATPLVRPSNEPETPLDASDIAREQHDFFNLVALVRVCPCACCLGVVFL